ncbi:MAG TPA: GNAT family N-acetyltransferase [Phototrophicaceae bacterium]|nr:GNAT family N-acetyltransferase [Phototrophicaceae bacterium]
MATTPITYQTDLDYVDWSAMRAILIADDFDNGRSVEQYERSFKNSAVACIAYDDGQIIGTARALSDGVCNAYIVDVWTYRPYRGRGIARTMIQHLLNRLPGQHVYLFTDDVPEFYRKIGFQERGIGLEIVVGHWLVNQ